QTAQQQDGQHAGRQPDRPAPAVRFPSEAEVPELGAGAVMLAVIHGCIAALENDMVTFVFFVLCILCSRNANPYRAIVTVLRRRARAISNLIDRLRCSPAVMSTATCSIVWSHDSAGAFYQILTRCSGGRYSLSPGFTPYASYQASILRKGPSTRKRAGGGTSDVTKNLRGSGGYSWRQICAQPRKKRCSPVKPPTTAAAATAA